MFRGAMIIFIWDWFKLNYNNSIRTYFWYVLSYSLPTNLIDWVLWKTWGYSSHFRYVVKTIESTCTKMLWIVPTAHITEPICNSLDHTLLQNQVLTFIDHQTEALPQKCRSNNSKATFIIFNTVYLWIYVNNILKFGSFNVTGESYARL